MLNGLMGAGGGMVLVPLLEAGGLESKKSHATSLAVIVPLSVVSAWLYWQRGWLDLQSVFPYLPGGIAGAIAGAWLLSRLHTGLLKILLGAMLIWGGGRWLWNG